MCIRDRPKTEPEDNGEITIDSDRFTTVFLAVLFLFCALFLTGEIRSFVQGHFIAPEPLHKSFFGIFMKVSVVITAIYFFIIAITLPKNSVKLACVLMGADLVYRVALSWLHVSPVTRHTMAVAGSGAGQIALVIFRCV